MVRYQHGISLYSTQTKQWYSFLSVFDNGNVTKNHVFISLCEVSPGIIWAGGYSSGIYQINQLMHVQLTNLPQSVTTGTTALRMIKGECIRISDKGLPTRENKRRSNE